MKTVLKAVLVLAVCAISFALGNYLSDRQYEEAMQSKNEEVRVGYEKAYFWAQVDARAGLWRVSKQHEDGTFTWIGTPNRSGDFPVYDPAEDMLNHLNFKLESIEKSTIEEITDKAKEIAEEIKKEITTTSEPDTAQKE